MARDSFFLLFAIRERVRDAAVRLVEVGLLRKICQNVIALLCYGQESVNQKMLYTILCCCDILGTAVYSVCFYVLIFNSLSIF